MTEQSDVNKVTEQSDVNKVTEQSDVNKVTNGRKYTLEGENARKYEI